jgi:hypothetical protein
MTELHDNPSIGTLRKQFGADFAPEFKSDDTLSSVLRSTGTTSLEEYREHSERGRRIVGTSSDLANTIVSHTRAVIENAQSVGRPATGGRQKA